MYREILEDIIKRSKGTDTECLLIANNRVLTRFSNSTIHQNTSLDDITLSIRVAIGNRIGKVTINQLKDDMIDTALEKALELAKMTPPDPEYSGLPNPSPILYREISPIMASPKELAEKVIEFIKATRGLSSSGALEVNNITLSVVNSNGISLESTLSYVSLEAIVENEESSGYTYIMEKDINDVDFVLLSEIASDKARRGKNPVEIPPGEYTVILEPQATGTIISFLGMMGFGAKQYQEGRSFLVGKLGQKITSEKISIWDYPSHPKSIGFPFDFEGCQRKDVVLIDKGVAKNLVYDTKTANKENKISTGNGLPQPNSSGPLPFNITLLPGETTLEEMISSTEKGILVTRFHYTNIVDSVQTIITGMTRDGTFLIEEGKIAEPIKNMRFTQSIINALSSVEMIGNKLYIAGESFIGSTLVPALKIGRFHFTGVTR
ncbi:MAG: TldD/PmbA family protein [bacterium]